jgi:hypothetical protein
MRGYRGQVTRARRPRQTMGKMPMPQNARVKPWARCPCHSSICHGPQAVQKTKWHRRPRRWSAGASPPLRDTGGTPVSDHGQDAHATERPCQTMGKMPMPQHCTGWPAGRSKNNVASASRRWSAGASRPCVTRAGRPRQTTGKMPMPQQPASDHGQDVHATAARVRPRARCPCHNIASATARRPFK